MNADDKEPTEPRNCLLDTLDSEEEKQTDEVDASRGGTHDDATGTGTHFMSRQTPTWPLLSPLFLPLNTACCHSWVA